MTVDLCGVGARLRLEAVRRNTTPAALTRTAVLHFLGDGAVDTDCGRPDAVSAVAAAPTVKITLRVPNACAMSLGSRAKAADVSQGAYIAALLKDGPPVPIAADHAAAVAALMASTDVLAAMCADLNALLRTFDHVETVALEADRATLSAVVAEVRRHLASAAVLLAELQQARRGRR